MDRSWNSTATRITAKQWELEQQISCYIVYNTCKERRSVFPEELACKSLFSFSFTQHIFQNNNFFFQTQDYHIETFNNTGTELFLRCVTNIRVRLKKISPKGKNFTSKPLVFFFLNKKTSRFLTIFPDFISIKLMR